jgi:hypothetical protein
MELYNYITQEWKTIWDGWDKTPKWDVHFEYLYMNFKNSLYLEDKESELTSSVIFGLRIAYAFFIEKNYDMSFPVFRTKVLTYGKNIFSVEPVIDYCYKSLKLFDEKKLLFYFHIDEFQIIDAWDAKNETKKLFKNIIRKLANYMTSESSIFIQPFFSGTTSRAITKQKTATDISFEIVDCPLLDFVSMLRIMDHFMVKFQSNDKEKNSWKFCAPLIRLLMDTGGLPRALEQLLLICFKKLCDRGEAFFKDPSEHDYDNIFTHVKNDLEKMYNIYDKVNSNKELAVNLMYRCVEGIPIGNDECLDEKLKITVLDLQNDWHFVLSPYKGLYLIEMPLLFICIYNDILKIVDTKFFQVIDRVWQEWELFVAHFITFRINLAIKMGKNKLTLRELHPGAYGMKKDLDNIVKLKNLRVCEAKEQFSSNLSNLELTLKSDGTNIYWKGGDCVVVNGNSAMYADLIFVMKSENGNDYLITGQSNWSKIYDEEDNKNLSDIKEHSELRNYEFITILFTTQPYKETESISNILIVTKENFKDYFGPVFSSRATFAFTKEMNPNFWPVYTFKKTIEGVETIDSLNKIVKKRPYIGCFYEENPKARNLIFSHMR